LRSIKETSIDCDILESNAAENLVCYGFGSVKSNEFGSNPTIETDLEETGVGKRPKNRTVLKKVKMGDDTYYYDETTKKSIRH
jgi:hypothetical protein